MVVPETKPKPTPDYTTANPLHPVNANMEKSLGPARSRVACVMNEGDATPNHLFYSWQIDFAGTFGK